MAGMILSFFFQSGFSFTDTDDFDYREGKSENSVGASFNMVTKY